MDLFSAKFLFLVVIALVVLGPDKLPGALRGAGRLLAELRRISAGVQEQSRSVMAQTGLAEPIEELRSAARALRQPLSGDQFAGPGGSPAAAGGDEAARAPGGSAHLEPVMPEAS